jgi:hypothetical protein
MRRPAALAVVALLAAGALAPAGAASGDSTTQSCLGSPSRSGPVRVAWSQLRNPILSYDTAAIRDTAIRAGGGRWHVLFTSDVGTTPTWRIAGASTPDLRHWSPPSVWPPQPGTAGVASPDITEAPDGTYVVTYQSDPADASAQAQDKLYYRTSHDLTRWSPPRRLMPSIHAAPSDRLIDAALAWTRHGLILGYKYGVLGGQQHFEVAWSPSGRVAGPWVPIGRPDITVYGDTIENYEFLQIDGRWHLLATSNNLDRPWLFTLTGNADDPQGWLQWSPGRELEVPLESWNRAVGIPSVNFDQENAAYLCDARRVDGYFYLLYIGSTELSTFGGWGHTKLGVARSRDLYVWEVPCGPGAVSTMVGCEPR